MGTDFLDIIQYILSGIRYGLTFIVDRPLLLVPVGAVFASLCLSLTKKIMKSK